MSTIGQVVTLKIDQGLFAVPVAMVQEILDLQPLLEVPHAPAHILGVADVRGEGVAVVDLRRLLGLAPVADNSTTRLVVLRLDTGTGSAVLALKTEHVLEVTSFDDDRVAPLPETGSETWDPRFVTGLGRRDGKLVGLLDLRHMFDPQQIAHNGISRAA